VRTAPALISAISQFTGHTFCSGDTRKSGLMKFVWSAERQEQRVPIRRVIKAEYCGNRAQDIFEFKHAVSPVQ
jgi:hypothetical protein